MSETLKNMIEAGRHILTDTKTRKPKSAPIKAETVGNTPVKSTIDETDPYRIFSKRCILEKPKKAEVVEAIKGHIEREEAKL